MKKINKEIFRISRYIKEEVYIFISRSRGIMNYVFDNSILLSALGYIVSILVWNTFNNTYKSLGVIVLEMVFLLLIVKLVRTFTIIDVSRIVLCFIIGIILSVLRFQYFVQNENYSNKMLNRFLGKQILITGIINQETSYDHDKETSILKVLSISNPENGFSTIKFNRDVNILFTHEKFRDLRIGEIIQVRGKLETPKEFEDFDYRGYLRNQHIFHIFKFAQFEKRNIPSSENEMDLYSSTILRLTGIMQNVRINLVNRIQNQLPEPQSSLLCGIILGSDRVFEDDFAQALRNTGTAHVVAASGYNVSLIVIAVNSFSSYIPHKIRLVLTVIFVWLYAMLSGLSPSIVRASIMVTLVLFATISGTKSMIINSLPVSAFIFAVIDPFIIYSVSFQLSFMATVGLVFVSPAINNIHSGLYGLFKMKLDKNNSIYQSFLSTLSCSLSTLPITALVFKSFSVVSPIVNLLISPVLEPAMFVGMAGLFASYLPKICVFSKYLFLTSWPLLKYFEKVVELFGSLSFSTISISNGNLWVFYLYIASLIFIVVRFSDYTKENFYFKD